MLPTLARRINDTQIKGPIWVAIIKIKVVAVFTYIFHIGEKKADVAYTYIFVHRPVLFEARIHAETHPPVASPHVPPQALKTHTPACRYVGQPFPGGTRWVLAQVDDEGRVEGREGHRMRGTSYEKKEPREKGEGTKRRGKERASEREQKKIDEDTDGERGKEREREKNKKG